MVTLPTGQLVTVGAQEVMVSTRVMQTVEVVNWVTLDEVGLDVYVTSPPELLDEDGVYIGTEVEVTSVGYPDLVDPTLVLELV